MPDLVLGTKRPKLTLIYVPGDPFAFTLTLRVGTDAVTWPDVPVLEFPAVGINWPATLQDSSGPVVSNAVAGWNLTEAEVTAVLARRDVLVAYIDELIARQPLTAGSARRALTDEEWNRLSAPQQQQVQFNTQLLAAADQLCHGRIIFSHEGGYSKEYVPFCGLAVVEAMKMQNVLRAERDAAVAAFVVTHMSCRAEHGRLVCRPRDGGGIVPL